MFQGLRTAMYSVKPQDLEKAKKWYSKLLGKDPYFDESFYVGFNVGGYELALDPTEEKISTGNNLHTYWGVSNIESAVARCLKLDATIDSEIKDVGGNIKVATVRDPFGNILGLIENPHFKLEN
jgi:predicted enzyme related to lactoylglutathione lyase